MPSGIHDCFTLFVVSAINSQLSRLADGHDVKAQFAGEILNVGFGTIYLKEFDPEDEIRSTGVPYIKREPDGQFIHKAAQYPGVVIEVACSQIHKIVQKLVRD